MDFIDPEECKGKLHEWITLDKTKKYIRKRFIKFITEFTPDKLDRVYYRKAVDMLNENKQAMEINYSHFKDSNPILSMWLGL